MTFEIKPNRIDSQDEIVALIAENLPSAASDAEGAVFGLTATNTTGYQNTALGFQSLFFNTTGYQNTALGFQSLDSNTTGYCNTAVGYTSLHKNTTGVFNTAVGSSSLRSNTTGFENTAIGVGTLINNTTGIGNTVVGSSSLQSNTTGSQNTVLGCNAGNNLSSGSNNTFIGNAAQPSSSSVSNEITLGNSSILAIRAQVTSITSLSDARDKKNIETLPTGLDFVNSLNPVKFDWNMRDGGKVDVPDTGFIAQDLVELEDSTGIADYLKLTFRDNPDKLEASYGRLVPILVKAIQDLSNEVNMLKDQING